MPQAALWIDVDCLCRRYRLSRECGQVLALGVRELGLNPDRVMEVAELVAGGRIDAACLLKVLAILEWPREV